MDLNSEQEGVYNQMLMARGHGMILFQVLEF